MARDKVKRAFVWIRKSLRIIDRTTLPGEILGEIRPTLDTFGWDRLAEVTFEADAGSNTSRATTSIVPEGVMRLILAASVEHSDPAVSHTLWIDHEITGTTTAIAVQTPALIIGATPQLRLPLMRRLLLRPGERLSGRAAPTTGLGITLEVNMIFVEIPVGEYISPV